MRGAIPPPITKPQPFSVGVFSCPLAPVPASFCVSLAAGSPSAMAWLNLQFIANTAYHRTGMFTIAAQPLKPVAPWVLCGAATVTVAGVSSATAG